MTELFYYSALYYLPTSSDIGNEQVVSPTTEANEDTNAAPARRDPGHGKSAVAPDAFVTPTAHVSSAEADALAKVLEMLTGKDMCLQKTEDSQARKDEDERMRGAGEIEMYSLMRGADFAG